VGWAWLQGVVKRHGIGGGPNTRQHEARRPGSVGPGRIRRASSSGKKMPGHYGDAQRTAIHLPVKKIAVERNLIYVRGSVAGKPGGVVVVRKQS
jgi:large subunit ribosomal protein L3